MRTIIMLLVTLAGFVPASGGVPSDSFNADRPTFIPQHFMYHAGGLQPPDRRDVLRTSSPDQLKELQ